MRDVGEHLWDENNLNADFHVEEIDLKLDFETVIIEIEFDSYGLNIEVEYEAGADFEVEADEVVDAEVGAVDADVDVDVDEVVVIVDGVGLVDEVGVGVED